MTARGHKAIACIHLPHLPWQAETRRNPDLAGKPAVIVDGLNQRPPTLRQAQGAAGSQRTVLDCSPDLRGVVPGMPVAQALSRNKHALLIEPDIPHYRILFERILKSLEMRVPDIEDAGLGLAYAGIWGLEKLYGSDARVVQILAAAASGPSVFQSRHCRGSGQRPPAGTSTCSGQRLDVRIGVGENKWLAYIAAAGSRPGSARKVTGEPGRFMSRFPVDLLPIEYSIIERLHSFGLQRMEDIAALPESAMQAQFGKPGALAWQLANGFDDRPLLPRRTQEAISEHLSFPDATASMAAILPAIESLLSRAFRRPRLAKRYVRETVLQAQVLRRPPWTLRVAFKEPAGTATRALFSIKAKLDGIALPGPLEDMRLTLLGLTGEAGRQESLWTEVHREQQLHDAVSQLQARLGAVPPIYQVRELEPWSRIPERRHALVQLSP